MMEKLLKTILPYKDVIKEGILYLRRHYLSPRGWTNWRRLFLHLIEKPDEDRDPHDHPWPFTTLILWGGYIEYIYDPKTGNHFHRTVRPFSIVKRKAEDTHRIIQHLRGRTWSLVLAGPTRRKWGFHTERGWVDHITYKLHNGEDLEPDEWPEDVINERRRSQKKTGDRT